MPEISACTCRLDSLPKSTTLWPRVPPVRWALIIIPPTLFSFSVAAPLQNMVLRPQTHMGWPALGGFVIKASAVLAFTSGADARRQREAYGLLTAPLQMRLVWVTLKGDETEVLATSLHDEEAFPAHVFKRLYHLMWGIEEQYKRVKCLLEIENFSWRSAQCVRQDFYAKTFAMNLTTILVWVAQAIADRLCQTRRHAYQVNFANAFSKMKHAIARLLLGLAGQKLVTALVLTMAASVEAVRPDRVALSATSHTATPTSRPPASGHWVAGERGQADFIPVWSWRLARTANSDNVGPSLRQGRGAHTLLEPRSEFMQPCRKDTFFCSCRTGTRPVVDNPTGARRRCCWDEDRRRGPCSSSRPSRSRQRCRGWTDVP